MGTTPDKNEQFNIYANCPDNRAIFNNLIGMLKGATDLDGFNFLISFKILLAVTGKKTMLLHKGLFKNLPIEVLAIGIVKTG